MRLRTENIILGLSILMIFTCSTVSGYNSIPSILKSNCFLAKTIGDGGGRCLKLFGTMRSMKEELVKPMNLRDLNSAVDYFYPEHVFSNFYDARTKLSRLHSFTLLVCHVFFVIKDWLLYRPKYSGGVVFYEI